MAFIQMIDVEPDEYPIVKVEEIKSGIGLVSIEGILQGEGITIDIIRNLIGLLYRCGDVNIPAGTTTISFSTPFDFGVTYVLHRLITSRVDGAIIGGTFSAENINGFTINVDEIARVRYTALIIK